MSNLQLLINGYRQTKDSLITHKLPAVKYTEKIDSLNHRITSIHEKVIERLNSIKQNASDKLRDLPITPEVKGQIYQLTSKIEGVNISTLQSNMPGELGMGKLNSALPTLNTQLNLSRAAGINDLVALPDLPSITNAVPDLKQVNNITNQAGSLQTRLDGASGTLSPINQVDKLAETEVSSLEEIKVLKEQSTDLPFGALGTEAGAKEELTKLIKPVALNHFAGKEQELQEAMEIVSKYKKLYGNVADISKLPKRRPNEMKGLPLFDRLLPGIALQIQKSGENLFVDFNPYVGYRFTGRITGGLGWNQRVAYNTKQYYLNAKTQVYGPRAFGEYNLWKGFCPRGEVEIMHGVSSSLTKSPSIDLANHPWVWGAFVGMKKDYKFLGRVKGTALVMVRLFDPHRNSPYGDVINARFGFEFPIKKKNHKTSAG
ncbi:MAG TPA: hypothetical protein VK666_19745 [Chryseolinea sp.]|nr:hypothetical protein [Chryseolinea sp.]